MSRTPQGTTGISVLVLFVSGAAGVGVPPSLPLAGISETERQLLSLDLPLLLGAFCFALVGVACSLAERQRFAGLLGVVSLLLVNLAGLLSGQFGKEGIGLFGTLIVTAPLALIIAARETKHRQMQRGGVAGKS